MFVFVVLIDGVVWCVCCGCCCCLTTTFVVVVLCGDNCGWCD